MQLPTKGVLDQIQKLGLVFQHNCFRTFRCVSVSLFLNRNLYLGGLSSSRGILFYILAPGLENDLA